MAVFEFRLLHDVSDAVGERVEMNVGDGMPLTEALSLLTAGQDKAQEAIFDARGRLRAELIALRNGVAVDHAEEEIYDEDEVAVFEAVGGG